MGLDVNVVKSLGQNVVGQNFVGQDVTGAKSLGQNGGAGGQWGTTSWDRTS